MPTFRQIKDEFDQTFGYVRQDIAALRGSGLHLNYTVALLICCASEMLAFHKDQKEHEVFSSLLPNEEAYQAIGKSMWEALRNGLAHSFRPQTIEIGSDRFRFTLSPTDGAHLTVSGGDPKWMQLSTKVLAERVITQITAYEKLLVESEDARIAFEHKATNWIKRIDDNGNPVASGWRTVFKGALDRPKG